MVEPRPPRAAILARDAAYSRLRRLTAAALTVATATTGIVAGVAASATHSRAVGGIALGPGSAKRVPPVPAPVATTPFAGAPQPQSASQSPAPVASSSAPVVVSGGS